MSIQLQVPYLPVTISPSGIEISISEHTNPTIIYILQTAFFLYDDDDNNSSNVINNDAVDYYLSILCIMLILLCFKLTHAFSRPPPVQRKRLPRRPALQILFKPDAISTSMNTNGTTGTSNKNEEGDHDDDHDHDDDISSIGDHSTQFTSRTHTSNNNNNNQTQAKSKSKKNKPPPISTPHDLPDSFAPLLSSSEMEILTDELTCDLLHATHVEGSIRLRKGRFEIPLDKDNSRPQLILDIPGTGGSSNNAASTSTSTNTNTTSTSAEAEAASGSAASTSPLKTKSTGGSGAGGAGGCKMTVVASIGSDGISNTKDLDVTHNPIPTTQRSLPLVKHAGILLDPPLPLINVAPTLIHFPTLFEDNVVKYTLRRIQIVNYVLNFISSASSFIEKVLWIIESKCQIHLGKVSLTPLYKGEQQHKKNSTSSTNDTGMDDDDDDDDQEENKFMEPQWRLNIAFSGHILLFGWIPIPFINITMPTWIIPQPHALLEHLCTNQPLASAKIHIEKMDEQRITLAILDAIEAWDFKLEAVGTPPALSADLSMAGGISVAVETMHGMDVSGGRPRGGVEAVVGNGHGTGHGNGNGNNGGGGGGVNGGGVGGLPDSNSNETLSTCTMHTETQQKRMFRRRRLNNRTAVSTAANNGHGHGHGLGHATSNTRGFSSNNKGFDANDLVPWKLVLALNGKVDRDRISVSVSKCIASHDPSAVVEDQYHPYDGSLGKSQISLSGQFVICKPDPILVSSKLSPSRAKLSSTSHLSMNLSMSNLHHTKILNYDDEQSVASILLYPEKRNRRNNLLQYDYEFDIDESTTLDAISLSIGASHPMLKGGTIITTILENFYAYGMISSRENSIIDMSELNRKRNILTHLPAVNFTAGIQNFFIPEESFSYSDDGQTKCLPELGGGQLMVRVMGGFPNENETSGVDGNGNGNGNLGGGNGNRNRNRNGSASMKSLFSTRNSRENLRNRQETLFVSEGIKVLVDFGIGSIVLNNESNVPEFPELEIFDDQKLQSLLSGSIDGSIGFHLRPQKEHEYMQDVLGKNLFNPLERYEIDFSGSKVFVKLVEANATLGHRRIIIPSESTVGISIVRSIVDMSFDGSTECEFHWDFQGASPILQVTDEIGQNPQLVCHEDRQQVALLISSLRQGRFNLNVSSVGGLTITEAATSRENREGLYDWKFFNAIVSPDEHSFDHMIQVLHDKRTMFKILQVVKLISADLEKLLNYSLRQLWRAKEIFDKEGVSEPGKAIPSYKMARLLSLFLCGDDSQVKEILLIVRRAVEGEGIDVLAMKELIRKNLSIYEEWAAEIDRGVRWVEVMLGSQEAQKPFVENNVVPLSLHPKYKNRFAGIPSAKELYSALSDKRHLPLDVSFSGLLSRIAPYLSFRQIEYILQTRSPSDWQSNDIRRLRYVYSVKKKVLDISESYGGLSFMPQSFFVSIFVGEATRTSMRAREDTNEDSMSLNTSSWRTDKATNSSTLQTLRQRRTATMNIYTDMRALPENNRVNHNQHLSPAGRIASIASQRIGISRTNGTFRRTKRPGSSRSRATESELEEAFIVGDSLLGPQDVAILLQAGLTSSMKGSTVVQLNQRMLLDLMASQPRIFAVAVLAEIGTPGGEGNPRGLTSALMALLDLDQSSFTEFHRLDMHELLESWLPGLTIPRRDDYLAGGRWASQSYYSAIYGVAKNILEDAEIYIAFKGHVQRVRHNSENDPVPTAKNLEVPTTHHHSTRQEENYDNVGLDIDEDYSKLSIAINNAKNKIEEADSEGAKIIESLTQRNKNTSECNACASVTQLYHNAFTACADLLKFDKLAFHADWFKSFYRRNYDALMVKSVYDNVIQDDDNVREWLGKLRKVKAQSDEDSKPFFSLHVPFIDQTDSCDSSESKKDLFFHNPDNLHEQEIVEEIIQLIFFDEQEREAISADPLVRLLISNPPGNYNFTIVSAMGVITEGKKGLELDSAMARLKKQRNVDIVRADTGTARSFEYNASKIEDAIESAVQMDKPYGILGYSQGCANGLFCESLLQSGTPSQQRRLTSPNSSLVCRQLLFSAANGSMHGPAMEEKIHRLIVMCEQFFKYQQGYCSRAFTTSVLEALTNVMDSAAFQKFVAGGGGTFLHQGSRAFWREAQHLPNVPTCVLRGVLEDHTTPESLQMISNLLTKHAGSPLHDSQVHVYDAVGRPIYTHNRNSKIMKNCEMGGSIQRTHHWSPLSDEVKFVETQRDVEYGTFLCAKDRHIFPWCDVNVRFGFVHYEDEMRGGNGEKGHRRQNTDENWEPLNN